MTEPNRELPLDQDLEAAEAAVAQGARPVHLSPANVALVFVGGAVGTGLRYWISAVTPHWAGVPVATFGINVVGALLLGVLLELLAGSNLDSGWSRRLRLGIGTGGLGGFTTYSALATDTVTLAAGHPGRGVGYALATVTVGAVASIAGIWLVRRTLRPTASPPMARP
jgi:CrcB protein